MREDFPKKFERLLRTSVSTLLNSPLFNFLFCFSRRRKGASFFCADADGLTSFAAVFNIEVNKEERVAFL